MKRVSENLHKIFSAAVRVDRARPASILRRHDRKRSQQPTDVIVVHQRRVIGELANQPCVLACIQRAVVIKKRRQHSLYKRLDRLRLHAQFARQEISGRFREDRDVQQVGLAGGI